MRHIDSSFEAANNTCPGHTNLLDVWEEMDLQPYDPIAFLFIAVVLGCLTANFLDRYLPAMPYTAVILVEGVLLSVLSDATAMVEGSLVGRSIFMWQNIDPELLLIVFLPPLLFSDCFSMKVVLFQRAFWECLMLAAPGVLLGAWLTGARTVIIFVHDSLLLTLRMIRAVCVLLLPVWLVIQLQHVVWLYLGSH